LASHLLATAGGRTQSDQTAFSLAPIITDSVQNTKRELYDEKLEDQLEMLDVERGKGDETKMQCKLTVQPVEH